MKEVKVQVYLKQKEKRLDDSSPIPECITMNEPMIQLSAQVYVPMSLWTTNPDNKECITTIINQHLSARLSEDASHPFDSQSKAITLFTFMKEVINQLKILNKARTSETYTTALSSFMRFRNDKDLFLNEMNADLIIEYEAYLKNIGITWNTISFYMRILRAVYNRAAERGLVKPQSLFKHVYTGIDKTVKRAIPLSSIKQIKELDLPTHSSLDFARDMFLFSFYTRGMSFIDMAYLKKSDLKNGILSYRRRKTGQQLFIKWEECMQEVVSKYTNNENNYLLPIITRQSSNDRSQYSNALRLINNKLKVISNLVDISSPLTMYVARHSWASIAKYNNIPIAVISESMGHDSENTTLIYLASLDTTLIDKANEIILKNL